MVRLGSRPVGRGQGPLANRLELGEIGYIRLGFLEHLTVTDQIKGKILQSWGAIKVYFCDNKQ